MARKQRIHIDEAFYHVMLRGNGGETIFDNNTDREMFLLLLNEATIRFHCRIHAFCLMSNHVHLAIQVSDVPLSKIIQNISFRYTRIINKKRGKIGHLFQGRFKAIMVDAENYLLTLIRYIHLNPVKAKLVNYPQDYNWSSYKAYLGKVWISWLTTAYVLMLFSSDKKIARYSFIQFTTDITDNDIVNFELANQKSFPVIGSDAFMDKLEIIQQNNKNVTNIDLQQIIQNVCHIYQVKEAQLSLKSKNRSHAKIRAIIAWLAVEFKISNITRIATYFSREHSTLSRGVSQLILSNYDELNKIKKIIKNAIMQA